MADQNREPDNRGRLDQETRRELVSWLIVVAALATVHPLGLFLLFWKLTGHSFFKPQQTNRSQQSSRKRQAPPDAQVQRGQSTAEAQFRHPRQSQGGQQAPGTRPGMQGVREQRGRKPVELNRGKAMTIWGGILTGIFSFVAAVTLPLEILEVGLLPALAGLTPVLGMAGLGIVLLTCGIQRRRKARRFRKYQVLIGRRETVSIAALAQAMPVGYRTACDDLQDMLEEGYLPTGYLDMGSGWLVLTEDGIREEPEPSAEPESRQTGADDGAVLQEIRAVNDAIADPVMSRKIDRIEEITGKILEHQRQAPEKAKDLRSFLGYYLPTTLKILNAYAQMEAQGIEENITAAKERIEGMMDRVVEGFEKQLDKLFQNDAMDITTDVAVLERMLQKDGLSGGEKSLQMES